MMIRTDVVAMASNVAVPQSATAGSPWVNVTDCVLPSLNCSVALRSRAVTLFGLTSVETTSPVFSWYSRMSLSVTVLPKSICAHSPIVFVWN